MQRHPPWILALTALVTVVMAGGLARLEFKSSEDTMIPSGSTIYTDNVRYQHQFGTDPMIIMFTGDRGRLLSGHNLHELRVLQRRLAGSGQYRAVLDALVRDEAQAKTPAARNRLPAEFQRRTQSDAARLAAVGPQTIDNPEFVKFLVEDSAGNVRPSLEGVFPDPRHAVWSSGSAVISRSTNRARPPTRSCPSSGGHSSGGCGRPRRVPRSSSRRSTTDCAATWRCSAESPHW